MRIWKQSFRAKMLIPVWGFSQVARKRKIVSAMVIHMSSRSRLELRWEFEFFMERFVEFDGSTFSNTYGVTCSSLWVDSFKICSTLSKL